MTEGARIGAIILAAGQSSRFRAADPSAPSKVVAPLAGKPLVRHVAEAALAARLDPVIVVTGFAREHAEGALPGLDVRLVHNPDHATGLASSLRAGVAALPAGTEGAAILLADMPKISAGLIGTLARIFQENPHAAAVVPCLHGQRGNPVIIRASLFEDVARLQGDVGARPLLQGRSDVIEVAISDESVAFDVDTPDALDEARA
ncbi:MAG: NTP transferase domain-containing protein [Beijerinckiaceae bacterium]